MRVPDSLRPDRTVRHWDTSRVRCDNQTRSPASLAQAALTRRVLVVEAVEVLASQREVKLISTLS
eukprot:1752401-Rhodomonas_salina.1